jgi:hypothetical protein
LLPLNVEIASSRAFFWAVEPSPLIVPLTAAEELEPPAPPEVVLELEEPLLLSEPQAASARAPTRARPPTRADRESFTEVVVLRSSYLVRAPYGGFGPDGRGWRPALTLGAGSEAMVRTS